MTTSRFGDVRTALVRATDVFLVIEPAWTLAATTLVFLAYLLKMGPSLPWVGIGLACLPFLLRLLRREYPTQRTAFDIPLVLLMTGAVIGWYYSPERAISLGALQCMVATCLLCYSWVNYRHPAALMRGLVVFAPVALLVVLLFFVLDLSGPSAQPNFVIGGWGEHHGLEMYVAVIGAVLFGMGAFGRNAGWRVVAIVVFLALLAIVVVMAWDAMVRLVHFESIDSRLPIWDRTISLLRESPFKGLGLGCWAVAYHGSTTTTAEMVWGLTHAHNAYLELWANAGALGLLALAVALIVGTKLSLEIVTSPRSRPWYGFGVGVILACVITLLVAVVESAPAGVPLVAAETYYYFISPLPWILGLLLVMAHRLVIRPGR